MKVTFTKRSLIHHDLEIVRDGGTSEKIQLETKTFMPHDLIHYVYEKEAGLTRSFWGLLARGARFSDFAGKEKATEIMKNNEEIRQTEIITGLLSGYLKSDISEKDALIHLDNMLSAIGHSVPVHMTEIFLGTFKNEFKKVWGHWQSLKKDEPLVLIF